VLHSELIAIPIVRETLLTSGEQRHNESANSLCRHCLCIR